MKLIKNFQNLIITLQMNKLKIKSNNRKEKIIKQKIIKKIILKIKHIKRFKITLRRKKEA